jgi:uncharacterized membrane protein YraQ (UPF0718 family)
MNHIKRYSFFLITIFAISILFVINKNIGIRALNTTMYSFKEMILIIPPIFVLLGLLDVWVPRETMIKYMGANSGLTGIALAIFLGSAAAGPLYAAFPIAAVFIKKGAKLSNVLIFLGAWSTTKIPMFLFELSSLGAKFALTRLSMSMIGIILIAYIVNRLMNEQEVRLIYNNANTIDK